VSKPISAAPVLEAHKRERRKQARPGELLDAALSLFVEKGFAATRVEEVAARAGVSKGTLFLYFPSKQALFKAVVHENAGRHLREALGEVAGYTGSSAELLREFLRRWWTQYGSTPAAGLCKLIMGEAANFPDLARDYQEQVVQPSHELLRRVLQRGIDRGEFRPVDLHHTVHVIMAPLIFLVMWKHSLAPCCGAAAAIDPETFIAQHADLMVRGLLKEPNA
jgi:TetR/AcrR family transcriptional regulator